MAEKSPSLNDSLMRLAAVPTHPTLTRDEWVAKFSRISMKSMVAVLPDAEAYSLDANWTLARVGSFWRADEEYHVYAMEHAIQTMVSSKRNRPQADMVIVTPIWVFRRSGIKAAPVASEELLRVAEQNFMRFFDVICKRFNSNG